MASCNTKDLIIDGAELHETITIKRDQTSRSYHVTAYPTQLTRKTTNENSNGTAEPEPITVKQCRWYTAGIIQFHSDPETNLIYLARPNVHELEITLECILEKSHKEQLAKRAREIYGLPFTADNFDICPFQTFIAQLRIDIDHVVKTFYGTLIDNNELHPMRIIFEIKDLDELSKIMSKLDHQRDHDIILSYNYSLTGTSTAPASLTINAEKVREINLEEEIFGTSKAESTLVSPSFMQRVSAAISRRLNVVETIGVSASSFGQDLFKQEIINAILKNDFQRFSIDDIKHLQSSGVEITDDLKANISNSMSTNQSDSTASRHNLWNNRDDTHDANQSTHLNQDSSNNSNSNNTIHGEIQQPKNIDAAIIHRWQITNGFTISLNRWNQQMATTCIEGRITTKDDTETPAEIPKRQEEAERQTNVIDQKHEPHLRCRTCNKCKKCRDWYFTGTIETWNWVRNYENWKKDDWRRWCDNHVWDQFKLRDGSTCRPRIHHTHDCFPSRLGFVPALKTRLLGGLQFVEFDTHFLFASHHTSSWISGPPSQYIERLVDYDFGGRVRHVFYRKLSSDVCLCEDNQTI